MRQMSYEDVSGGLALDEKPPVVQRQKIEKRKQKMVMEA